MTTRTPERVRKLTADDLEIGVAAAIADHASNRPDDPPLESDDARLAEVRELIQVYGGVIFSGPPGTSKTWYAGKIAMTLADGDGTRVRFVQFHPSYQYEDFVQGFVPKKTGNGFELKPRYFLEMCRAAQSDPSRLYVLVIDELSRGDPGRVFGEALTYVEKSKRGLSFTLASGNDSIVPANLIILATMNPLDRGVDEVDAAFERRFAKIAMEPDRGILLKHLDSNQVADPLRTEIVGLFDMMNGRAHSTPQAAVGHTFFLDVRDVTSLASLWQHQLRFLVEKAYRLDPDSRAAIVGVWERVLASPNIADGSEDVTESAQAGDSDSTGTDQDDDVSPDEPR